MTDAKICRDVRNTLETLLTVDFANRPAPRHLDDYRRELRELYPDEDRAIEAALAEFLPRQMAPPRPARRMRPVPLAAAAVVLAAAAAALIAVLTPPESLETVARRVAQAANARGAAVADRLVDDVARLHDRLPERLAEQISAARAKHWWDEREKELSPVRHGGSGPEWLAPRAAVVPPLSFRFATLRSKAAMHYVIHLKGSMHSDTLRFAATSPAGEAEWTPSDPIPADRYVATLGFDPERHGMLARNAPPAVATFTLLERSVRDDVETARPVDGSLLSSLARASALLEHGLATDAIQALVSNLPDAGDPLRRVHLELLAEAKAALGDRAGFERTRDAVRRAAAATGN